MLTREYTDDKVTRDLTMINEFLLSDDTNEDKEKLIIDDTDIYWPEMVMSPL